MNNKIIILVFFIIIILFLYFITDKAPEKHSTALSDTSGFQILSYSGKWEYDKLYVIGEVKNIGSSPAGVQLEAIARDSKGTLINSVKFWPNSINNIQPGQTTGVHYKVTSDKSAKSVELKIISVTTW